MSDKREIKRVFIASPSDVRREREIFRDVIEQVNSESGERLKIRLEALGWEDTMPGKGRPQALINKDIENSDLVIFVLWKRWGSRTGKYSSGFEEEFELANKLNVENRGRPEILLYFRSISSDMLADPGAQLAKVIEFRNKIEEEKNFLYQQYETEDQWRDLFREHLYGWLHKTLPTASASMLPAVANAKLTELKQSLDKAIKGRLAAAQALADSGRITEAEVQFAQATSDHPNNPAVLNRYGIFLLRIGLLDKAEKIFIEISELSAQKSDRIFQAIAFGNLGLVYNSRGDLDLAEEETKKSMAINEEFGDKFGLANGYGNLGAVHLNRGNLDKAVEMIKKSLALAKKLGSKEVMASCYGNLGNVHVRRGDPDKAVKMYEKSLALHSEVGRKEGMASDYANLGIVYKIRGDLDKAVEMYGKSLALFEELGNKNQIEKTRDMLNKVKEELTVGSE